MRSSPERATRALLAGAHEGVPREEDPTCFVHGGVAFEICPAPGVTWAIGREHRQFAGAYATTPVAGEVRCVVSPAPELCEGLTREIRWEWSGDVARVETGRVRVELRRLSPRRYAASAKVLPGEAGCSGLVTALTAAVVSREGGFVLHAAGVEIDGRAVLFVGPSGAGKTTASNHCRGARWIARDRAAVYPTALGWYAAGMPGGDPIDLPQAPSSLAPLGAILRVRKGRELALVEPGLASGLRNLRESVTTSVCSPIEEGTLLERLVALSRSARVADLGFSLGVPLRAPLSAWLRGETTCT